MFRSGNKNNKIRPAGTSSTRPSILSYVLFSFISVGALSVFLIFFHHKTTFLDKAHTIILEKSAPFSMSIEKFSKKMHSINDLIIAVFSINEINSKKEYFEKQSSFWKNKANQLEIENRKLKKISKFVSSYPKIKITTELITYPHIPFSHQFSINAGFSSGVKLNAPIISHKGVIGRVIEVNKKSSKVLLLTDVSSRIPVYIEKTDEQAILAGSHRGEVNLVLRQKDVSLVKGSRIVTSGKGGMFNPGLFVGFVKNEGDDIVLLAQKDLNYIEEVFILETHNAND